jgi:hypothetical protein
MDRLNREIYLVQNPSLGAASLWRFICGYNTAKQEGVPLHLVFLVLPLVFRRDICEVIIGTQKQSGLAKFVDKFFKDKHNDCLYTVSDAVNQYKPVTLSSIQIGLNSNLFSIDIKTALVYPKTKAEKIGVSKSTSEILKASEKLGIWYSSLTLYEICMMLKVRF